MLFAPAGTPRPVVDKLNAALRHALADAKVASTFAKSGMDLFPAKEWTPEAGAALLKSEIKLWGDVIRNVTAQPTRRVDLTFGVSYSDDLEKAERVLREIVTGNKHVLADPSPMIKVHQMVDSSVNFIVRPWTRTEHYWDVYWEITRAVKERFDQEGISIPFAKRDVYVHMEGGPAPPAPRASS